MHKQFRSVILLSCLFASVLWSQSAPPSASPVPPLPADIPASAEHFSVIIMNNPAGQQAVWTASDGTLHMFFQFNDRGRGPKTTSILKLDPTGIPIEETVKGNDYLKSPVDETFSIASGKASWKNTAEQGSKQISGPGFYSALNGSPAELGLLAAAALHNGGKIALLPEGEVRVQRLSDLDIESGSQKKHVGLYSATGLDFSPTYFWLDDSDNDHPKFFASVDDWASIIPEGWESAAKPLMAAQDKVKQSRSADLAAKLAHRRAQPTRLQTRQRFRRRIWKNH